MPFQFPAGMTAAQKTRVVSAVCANAGYIGDSTAPAMLAFFNDQVAAWLRGQVRASEGARAATAARSAAETDVNASLSGLT